VVVLVLAAAVARPVARAASEVLRVVLDVLEVAAITVASLAGIAVLAALTSAAVRVRRYLRDRPRPYRLTVVPGPARTVPEQHRPELAPRIILPALPPADSTSGHQHIGATPDVVTRRGRWPR
jgi:hypothetical protein